MGAYDGEEVCELVGNIRFTNYQNYTGKKT